MTLDVWMQAVRYALMIAGAYLAKQGVIPQDQVGGLVDQVVNWLPGTIALASAAWGLWVRWRTKAVPAHVAARIDVPTVSPITGTVQK